MTVKDIQGELIILTKKGGTARQYTSFSSFY